MSPFEIASLSSAARWSVTFTTLTLILVSGRALARSARTQPSEAPRQRAAAGPLPWLLGAFAVAAGFAHVPALTATLPRLFPVGIGLGLAAAAGSLFVPAARRAFAGLTDGEMRLMLAYRAIYGALLFGLAGVGVMPPAFALSAGLGDLVVGWLALAAPRSLDAAGPRGVAIAGPRARAARSSSGSGVGRARRAALVGASSQCDGRDDLALGGGPPHAGAQSPWLLAGVCGARDGVWKPWT